jgi:hypothetical protein
MAPEEPVGRFFGSLFHRDDVDVQGPKDGTTEIQTFDVAVDLRPDGGPTAPLLTTRDVEPGWVTVLGFLDTDGNADLHDALPEGGDPCTVPDENEFEVVPAGVTPAVVRFGILYPP